MIQAAPLAALSLEPFEVAWGGQHIKADFVAGSAATRTLIIHGAGASERRRFATLRSALCQRGFGSTAFDCIGHGETGGSMRESSLSCRTRQAEAVLDSQPGAAPLAVIGISMGAYNAIKLLETRVVAALVLVVPGVYTPSAYDLLFGPAFSAAIRRERSWDDTDAWRLLEQYPGRLLVIAAENDAVIPAEIPRRLVEAARISAWRRLHVVPGAQHNRLFSLLVERPEEFENTMAMVATCLSVTG